MFYERTTGCYRDEAIEYHEIPEIDNVNQNAYNV